MTPRLLIAKGLVLDSAGADGMATEVSTVVEIGRDNAAQLQLLIYALTGTNVSVTLESALDRVNWGASKASQTASSIGRKLLTAETALSDPYLRWRFTITGTGKAILDAHVQLSSQ